MSVYVCLPGIPSGFFSALVNTCAVAALEGTLRPVAGSCCCHWLGRVQCGQESRDPAGPALDNGGPGTSFRCKVRTSLPGPGAGEGVAQPLFNASFLY